MMKMIVMNAPQSDQIGQLDEEKEVEKKIFTKSSTITIPYSKFQKNNVKSGKFQNFSVFFAWIFHFWGKTTKIISRVNSQIFTNSPLWFLRLFFKKFRNSGNICYHDENHDFRWKLPKSVQNTVQTSFFWCFYNSHNYFFGSFNKKSLFDRIRFKEGNNLLLRNSKSGIMFWKFIKKLFKASYRMFEADAITNLFIYSFILRSILVNSQLFRYKF